MRALGRAALFGALLAAAPLAAQEPAAALACGDCHDDVHVASPAHGAVACADCHSAVVDEDHGEAARAQIAGGELCGQCHDPGPHFAESVHAALACVDCHGPAHAVPPIADPASPVAPVQQFKTCGGCHSEPPELIGHYLQSVHARALLLSGLASAPACSDCHGVHDIFPPADPRSRVSRAHVPETCGSCHVYILADWQEHSEHGMAWKDGYDKAPVCTTCHASHRVLEPRAPAQRLKSPQTCGGCHGEAFSTYRDSFHGKATDLGFKTAAVCSDCHTPHKNLGAEDPRSSVHPANLAQTCGQCHGTVSASFLSFDPHAQPHRAERNRAVHFIWLAMTSLLIGVFGFFGVHDLLWLQRSIVGFKRGELARHDETSGPHVRRFGRLERGIHLTVITTFLLLAATGLPLRFHHQEWAKGLSVLFGGVGLTSVLHRLAAVATFAYFAVHVFHLARRALVDREPGLFYGWRSLVPRRKDISDLGQNLRYFLYLGRRPQLDRWTYWEKFDYFAVFWGVAIIGLSGLVLWFPSFFTRLLPGWALNAAYVIHSDEALLAVCFIFVFHFFHTHLRPEAFPLDPVIFTGTLPLQRLRDERPLEYERLVRTGELDGRLVDPPTPRTLRRARLIGFTAVAIGLLLAIAILWSVLAG